MFIDVDILPFVASCFGEPVHVELPDEGRNILVLKVFRKDVLSEAGDLGDDETIPIVAPSDKLIGFFILYINNGYLNHFQQFGYKNWYGGLWFGIFVHIFICVKSYSWSPKSYLFLKVWSIKN